MSKCHYHAETDATAFCGRCGKGLCPVCRRSVREVSYCEDCLVHSVSVASAPRPWRRSRDSRGAPRVLGPLFLIVLGSVFLLGRLDLFFWHWFAWSWQIWRFWPLILVMLGIYWLRKRVVAGGPG